MCRIRLECILLSSNGELSKAQRMYSTRIDGSTANVWDMPRSAAPDKLNILCSCRIHSVCSTIHSEYSRRIHSEECSRIHSEYGILPELMEVLLMCATCRAQRRWVSCSLGLSLPFPLFSSFSRSRSPTFPFPLSLFLPLPLEHAAGLLSGPG